MKDQSPQNTNPQTAPANAMAFPAPMECVGAATLPVALLDVVVVVAAAALELNGPVVLVVTVDGV